jgi:outer membrane protein assembly factor BamD (BamD/ComL family)
MAQAETAASGTRVQEPSRAGDESEPLFDDEVMLLRDANEHLRRDQPLRALSALAEHARRFPRGALAALRIAVRIQALCALGKQRQAADEAESFLRAHPGSPYAPRVRSGCSPADASQ